MQRKHLNEELTNVLVATANVPAAEGVQNLANFVDLLDVTYQLRSRIAALVRCLAARYSCV